MAKPFYERLHGYFNSVGAALKVDSDTAAIFPNGSDKGTAREQLFAQVLKNHLPSNCNIKLGGFVFNLEGDESKQMDIIISNSNSIQFNALNTDSGGKSFNCIEGCLAVVSMKSKLDKQELFESLKNLASLPEKRPLGDRNVIGRPILNFDDFPYKMIVASKAIAPETLERHLIAFYEEHPEIPMNRRPNLIYVAGELNIVRAMEGSNTLRNGEVIPVGRFILETISPDVFGLGRIISEVQAVALASQFINYQYFDLINRLPEEV